MRCDTAGKFVVDSHLLIKRLLPLLACGPASGGPPDGDAGTDATDVSIAVTPLEIPWLAEGAPPVVALMFTPCPAGWHDVVEAAPESGRDVVTCDPYGDTPGGTEPDTCPDGWKCLTRCWTQGFVDHFQTTTSPVPRRPARQRAGIRPRPRRAHRCGRPCFLGTIHGRLGRHPPHPRGALPGPRSLGVH